MLILKKNDSPTAAESACFCCNARQLTSKDLAEGIRVSFTHNCALGVVYNANSLPFFFFYKRTTVITLVSSWLFLAASFMEHLFL